jgi:hypothetical protein
LEIQTEQVKPILLDTIPFTAEPEAVIKAMRVRKVTPYIEELVRESITQAREIARPKAVYMVAPVRRVNETSVEVGGVLFTSRVLSKCLLNLNRVFPCLCTCGREIDAWTTPADDVMRAYCIDTLKVFALGAAIRFLDNHLKTTYNPGTLTHMNPGEFEDWPITQQTQMFSLFRNAEELVGVTLNSGCVMRPMKSRSGIYFANEEGFESCQFCPMKKCPSRRARYQPEKLKEYGVTGGQKSSEQEA